ncbi:hypothetical protein [Bacterioplanoides sp.]|uniref:hypothetical protein n=1 Tax=Bacterioplanoides sp. TaxID=2066072 RepID=UPI003B5AAD1A
MEECSLGRSDVAGITSRSESAVSKWLDGTNLIPTDCALKILAHSGLPENTFTESLLIRKNPGISELTGNSVILYRSGQRFIIDLNVRQYQQLIHAAVDLAFGNEPGSNDGGQHGPDYPRDN